MALSLPARFNKFGLLPPGDYRLTLTELRNSMLVKGPDPALAGWDALWRSKLVDNLDLLVNQLWKVGIENVFVDGSFVEDKLHPNDIDGYFECNMLDLASGTIEGQLNQLDANKCWTWDATKRRPHPSSVKLELPMWHFYKVELWPHYNQPSGIVDAAGNQMQFPSAFRRSRRERRQKGIVRLVKS